MGMTAHDPHSEARRLLNDLAANGGRLEPQPAQADGLKRVLLDYQPGADRNRCRALLAEAKADAAVWAAVLSEISGLGRAAA